MAQRPGLWARERFIESIRRHEYLLAGKLGVRKGQKVCPPELGHLGRTGKTVSVEQNYLFRKTRAF